MFLVYPKPMDIYQFIDTDYYNYLTQFDFGKYMAGDVGGTLTIKRQFPNGTTVGGFSQLRTLLLRILVKEVLIRVSFSNSL